MIIIIILAVAFSLFLIIPFGGRVGLLREATISFLLRKPPRFISMDISLNKVPGSVKAGESLMIKGDETLVVNRINANTFFPRYLTVDIPGFGKANDLHEPIQTAEIRKQLLSTGLRSMPIDVYYIDHPIAKIPLVIEVTADEFMRRLSKVTDVQEKISILRSAHASFPDNPYFLNTLEQLLLQQADYEGLVRLYKTILEREPGNLTAQERLSGYYIKLGRLDEAREIDAAIVGQGLPSAETYRRMALTAEKQGQQGERIAHLEKAHAIERDNEDVIIDLGKAYTDAGDSAKAMELYRSAAPRARRKEILVPVIQDALERKDFKEAEPLLKRYVGLYPNDKNAVAQLGQLMGNLGDPSSQIDYYRKASRLSPNDPILLYNLAVAHDKAGNAKEALDAYKAMLKIKPGDADALTRAAALSLKTGRHADAYRYYSALVKKSGSRDNLKGLLSAATGLRDTDKIISAATEYLEKAKDYEVAMQLGYAHEAKAEGLKGRARARALNEALDAYNLAIRLNPSSEKAGQKIVDLKIEILRLMKTP
ncbi:MAG TPA: tetratricopeptide repeat protein [Deltaproteobacteria bacterium]|nr:tetratricopeptide repeat protein [Deltaproteobacteria bacterium]